MASPLACATASIESRCNGPQGTSAGPLHVPDDREDICRISLRVALYGLDSGLPSLGELGAAEAKDHAPWLGPAPTNGVLAGFVQSTLRIDA